MVSSFMLLKLFGEKMGKGEDCIFLRRPVEAISSFMISIFDQRVHNRNHEGNAYFNMYEAK